jgi:hypothetical protein
MPGKKVLRTGVGIFLLLTLGLAGSLFCVDLSFYRTLFNRGVADFNNANYEQAISELRIAAFGFVDSLPDFEGAQIYIAVAADKLGRAEDARKATLRVVDAEHIAPSYSGLAIPDPIRSQFEVLAQKHMSPPELALLRRPATMQVATAPDAATPPTTATLAALTSTAAAVTSAPAADPLPPVTASAVPAPVTETVPPPPPPVTASATQPPLTTTIPSPPIAASTPPSPAAGEQERLATERAEARRAAAEREAALESERQRAAGSKAEQDRLAAARNAEAERAVSRAELDRVAAARKAEETRAAADRAERERAAERQRAAAAQKIDEERIAAERERRLAEERRRIEARTIPVSGGGTATVRQAEAALQRGDLDSARAAYQALLEAQDRDTLLHAGAGLYRLGDFRGAVRAFGKVGALRSGEEVFRYYAAVSLYETGQYAAAKKQLACALPYIQTTPETVRYQTKIEGAID